MITVLKKALGNCIFSNASLYPLKLKCDGKPIGDAVASAGVLNVVTSK